MQNENYTLLRIFTSLQFLFIFILYMCWNQKISLNTFLFSFFGISFAYFNNVINIYGYLFYLSFVSMQLVEYFAWGNLNDKKMNRFLSQIGLFLIVIQPVLFTLSHYIIEKQIKTVLIASYFIFILFCVFYFPIDFSMNKAPNGHLAWNWLRFHPIIIFIWVAYCFGLFLYENRYFEFSVYLIIFLAIFYTYYKTNTWGSLWCWISNLLAAILILQVFFDLKLSNCFLVKK